MTAAGYDGSIRIDTSIDSKGFNDGVKNVSGQAKVIGQIFKSLGREIGGFFGNIVKVIGDVIGAIGGTAATVLVVVGIAILAVLGIIGVVALSARKLFELNGYAKDLKVSFENLKLAFATAFQPLVTAALPIIQKLVDWMTKLLITVQMYIAAFMGQKTIMVAVANSAKDASGSVGKLAKNAEKAKKAADGALASFDEISVLQMEKNQDEVSSGGGSQPDVLMKNIAIDSDVLTKVGAIMQAINDAKTAAEQLWAIISYYTMDILNKAAIAAGQLVTMVVYFVMKGLNDAAISASKLLQLIGYFVSKTLNDASIAAGQLIQIVVFYVSSAWENIKIFFTNIWTTITQLWSIAGAWFSVYVAEPIRKAFEISINWIGNSFVTVFTWVQGFVKGIINNIIGFINGMVSSLGTGLNFLIGGMNSLKIQVPDWIPGIGGRTWQSNISMITAPQIPYLATGAVIPANAPFAAVLGDQKSGTNIEAPADLIRQIVQEEIGNMPNQRVTIDFGNSSMGALIRALNPEIKQDNDRRGSSLISGATA